MAMEVKMNPVDYSMQSDDYRRIEKAIGFIEANVNARPTLDQIAAHVNISRFHFDRLFKRWAGISPMQFLQYLTLDYTKRKLSESGSVLDAALAAGLSGPGRLHDLFVTFATVSPALEGHQLSGKRVAGTAGYPFGSGRYLPGYRCLPRPAQGI
jgi:AraC family transcriptional regulator of adaptative response/methylated-DNA-[protein]-cysteine methyltransferase